MYDFPSFYNIFDDVLEKPSIFYITWIFYHPLQYVTSHRISISGEKGKDFISLAIISTVYNNALQKDNNVLQQLHNLSPPFA